MPLELIRLPYAPGNLEPLTITFRHERLDYGRSIAVAAEFQRNGGIYHRAIRTEIGDLRSPDGSWERYHRDGRNLSEQQLHELRWRLMNEYIDRENRLAVRR